MKASTKTLSSNTRKTTGSSSVDSHRPQLLDNNGRNVTPKPLIEAGGRAGGASTDASASTSISAQPPIAPHSSHEEVEEDAQSVGGFSDDDDMNEGSGVAASESNGEDSSSESQQQAAAESRKAAAGTHAPASPVGRSRAHAQKREKLTDAQLDAIVTLQLTETPTICLLSLKQQRVLQDSLQHKDVAIANDRYDAACIAIQKGGPELYPSRGVQTINVALKSKSVTAAPPQTTSEGCQADNWDIYDSVVLGRSSSSSGSAQHAGAEGSSVAQAAQKKSSSILLDKMVDAMVMTALAAPGCLIDADSSVRILPPQSVLTKSKGGKGSTATASSSSSSSQAATSSNGGKSAVKPPTSTSATAASTTASAVAVSKPAAAAPQAAKVVEVEDPTAAALAEVKAAASAAWASGGGGTGGSDEDGEEEILSASALLSPSSEANGESGGSGGAGDHKSHGHGHVKKPSDKHDAKAPTQDAHTAVVAAAVEEEEEEEELEDGAGPLDVVTQLQASRVLSSRGLLDSLGLVERAVQQNLYHNSHRLYRSGPAQDLLERMLEAGQKKGYSGAAAILSEHSKKGGSGKDHSGNRQDAGTYGFAEGSAEEEAEAGEAKQIAESGGGETGGGHEDESAEENEGGGEGKDNAHEEEEEKKDEGGEDSTELTQKRSSSSSSIPGLLKLWTFSCKEVEGLNVSSLVWNKANRDLLAVSYGPYDFNQAYTGIGLIALWNLSNPESPLALLHAPDDSGVTAIDFSSSQPSLLAAGLYDGSVCVYDVAKILSGENPSGLPDLCSDQLIPGTHTEAVWQVKFVATPNAEQDTENIISISTDGKVLEWTTQKGLQFEPLMVLKRARSAPEPGAAGKPPADGKQADKSVDALSATGSEGLLSRTASGLTFDFPASDLSQYIVGTEDGLLARCSVGYSEQYLDVVKAHSGPINRVRISPFLSSACLTASSDWSVRLWKMNVSDTNGGSSSSAKMRPLTYTTDNVHEAMADIAWSPAVATRFASVARDGQVQIWDASSLQPLLDCPITVDEDVWRAQLAQEEAEREAELQRLLEEERARRRVEDEGIEEDDDFEREVLQAVRKKQAKEAAELEGKANEAEGGGGGGKTLDEDDEHMGGNSFAAKQAAAIAEKIKKGPPRKKLSCVIFADNTHVLLTGDANGAVDVYRIQGLGGSDVLSTRTSVPAAGTEEYEMQLSLLDGVLQTMV